MYCRCAVARLQEEAGVRRELDQQRPQAELIPAAFGFRGLGGGGHDSHYPVRGGEREGHKTARRVESAYDEAAKFITKHVPGS